MAVYSVSLPRWANDFTAAVAAAGGEILASAPIARSLRTGVVQPPYEGTGHALLNGRARENRVRRAKKALEV